MIYAFFFQTAFKTPGRSLVKTGVMMIGEFDFGEIFFPSDNSAVPELAWVLFIVFVIIITLLLMNLLVCWSCLITIIIFITVSIYTCSKCVTLLVCVRC